MTRHSDRPTIGLALGAGAARGCAHLGVLRAIREAGIPIDFVAGTSIGSLVGAVFTCGKTEELRRALLQLDWKAIMYYFVEFGVPRAGLINGKRIADFINQFIADADIEDLPLPYRAVAADVMSGQEVVLDQGPVIEAVRCSISMPGVFTPVPREGRFLVDGGIVNPVPVSVVRNMGADLVLAVDVNHDRVGSRRRQAEHPAPQAARKQKEPPGDGEEVPWHRRLMEALEEQKTKLDQAVHADRGRRRSGEELPNMIDVLGNSLRIMEAQIADSMLRLSPPDALIRPEVGTIGFLEFNLAEEAMAAGYEAAQPVLEEFLKAHPL